MFLTLAGATPPPPLLPLELHKEKKYQRKVITNLPQIESLASKWVPLNL